MKGVSLQTQNKQKTLLNQSIFVSSSKEKAKLNKIMKWLISAYLSTIITENSHHTHRHCFVDTASQGLAIKGKNKGDILLTGTVNNVV